MFSSDLKEIMTLWIPWSLCENVKLFSQPHRLLLVSPAQLPYHSGLDIHLVTICRIAISILRLDTEPEISNDPRIFKSGNIIQHGITVWNKSTTFAFSST